MDITLQQNRKYIIDEISSRENKQRKEEHFKRAEVYQDRSEPYLYKQLEQEFDHETIQELRMITSVNLPKRIVDEKASIYSREPVRTFTKRDGTPLTEAENKQLENIYSFGKYNTKLRKANRRYELHDQTAIQVIPKDGIIQLRSLSPHQYDVIPNSIDPEKADAYILSVYDRSMSHTNTTAARGFEVSNPPKYYQNNLFSTSDGINQKIADGDDYKKSLQRYVFWSDQYNFITNGNGEIIDPITNTAIMNPTDDMVLNPLGKLPFVDLSLDKESEFWVRNGSSNVSFGLEFSALLTDIMFINKMQGFAQGIVYSEKPPVNFRVGPNHLLHLPLDPNKEVQPRFEFVAPNANISSSLELVENFLRLFLTSKGIDPKTVSGKAETQRFNSGIERLLAMIDKFEASRESIDLFKWSEQKILELTVGWSNLFQGVTQSNGMTEPLIPELQLASLPEDIVLSIQYESPEMIQTKSERSDDVIKMMDAGLMSRSEAISEIRGITEEQAIEVVEKIDKEGMLLQNESMESPALENSEDVEDDNGDAEETET